MALYRTTGDVKQVTNIQGNFNARIKDIPASQSTVQDTFTIDTTKYNRQPFMFAFVCDHPNVNITLSSGTADQIIKDESGTYEYDYVFKVSDYTEDTITVNQYSPTTNSSPRVIADFWGYPEGSIVRV